MGEPVGALTMRWRLAPDGFEATPGAAEILAADLMDKDQFPNLRTNQTFTT